MEMKKEIVYQTCKTTVFILLILTGITFKPLRAHRPLKGQIKPGPEVGVMESSDIRKVPLQRGPVPPSMPSTCTYIGYPVEPGHDGRHCQIHG